MPLNDAQQREVGQLLLVARAYLALGDPENDDGAVPLGETKDAFTPSARVSLADWSRAMKAAHLASAAIRLASVDDVLDAAKDGRPVYHDCRLYFGTRSWSAIAVDPRGSSCSEWFHVMLRDAIAHREPPRESTSDGLAARYEARQHCIETTTLDEAHARLKQTTDELAEALAAKGIVLASLAEPPRLTETEW